MFRKMSITLVFILSLFAQFVQAESILGKLVGQQEDTFLSPDEAFQLDVVVKDASTLQANFSVTPGHYLYQSRMQLTAEDATIAPVAWPDGEMKKDPNFGDQEVYHHDTAATVNFEPLAAGQSSITINAKYQGCSEKGLCYAPVRKTFTLAIPVAQVGESFVAQPQLAPSQPIQTQPQVSGAVQSAQQSTALLETGNIVWIILGFFGAGLLLSFTPCVLPMIPILSSIIVGQQQSEQAARSPFFLSVAYVLGMALTYTLAGVAAGLSGQLISQSLQNVWVLGATAIIFVLLSLSMFGFYELKLPSSIENKMLATSQRLKGGEYIGVFIMGALSALIVSPCVAAPLAGALLYIGQTHNVFLGGMSLFALAMGMGVPLLLIGASAGKLIPKAGAWMDIVKHVFGLLMLAMAVWIVAPVINPTIVLILSAILAIMAGFYAWQLSKASAQIGKQVLSRGIALLMLIYGAALLIGGLSGGQSVVQPLRHLQGSVVTTQATALPFERVKNLDALNAKIAAANGNPVMLDFYADWCVACKEMEHETFVDPTVQALLADTVWLQADVTENNADDQALLKAFDLFGPPGILFFDQQGTLMKSLTTIGFKKPTAFQTILKQRAACLNQTSTC